MANAQGKTLRKDAITYALENKSDAKKARLKVENSKYQIQEVRSRALPKITANGGTDLQSYFTNFLDAGSFGGDPGTTIQATFGQNGFPLLGYP
jgi:outer membrane protein TolC